MAGTALEEGARKARELANKAYEDRINELRARVRSWKQGFFVLGIGLTLLVLLVLYVHIDDRQQNPPCKSPWVSVTEKVPPVHKPIVVGELDGDWKEGYMDDQRVFHTTCDGWALKGAWYWMEIPPHP